MARHSKLQKQVLSLYKQFLRAAKEKPGFMPLVCSEFRRNSKIPRTDVMHIEYLLRRGQRQLELLRNSNTKQLAAFSRFNQKNFGP
ncbi:succinate dehydrogenase assembly factor 1, mitochondrial [Hemiscyllium ocellatum]|uniref:succinate dehydrogenase assembly factor 1, mitochondrial n=1 Tax=Hemiscyllium ocellatum TaxID=170820 RepID=UPI00296638DF|nr:succinate dehydrogenase assembly factor 1, mitochondrial [Hemiscyllium ocellatum]XP_060712130.1 succinate dehydrogenase assembly factor 1, mitochondrial [Hemiscyllium ocellatum]XP_060712131.1 succinate dehydrogenase assembly factor 1, mitochondrial [Hemiscyllium ocellatum]XP_060712132.1 succinate dehydrogenase assembly factor 1, mitochondrial [Hemiscyllium ocellatum]XP_060712133.1 succinate dehydrogenase assembly factor 1, mitochondrial [Hemiscyllium ocellatum]XP_060712134.1 succinate dehyd